MREARYLADKGVDAIIAQGAEAGGHRGMFLTDDVASQVGTFALVPQIVDAVDVPVIAAGGIADGRGIAAAFALGASGVQIGTAYLRTPEARISDCTARRFASARDEDSVLTNVFTGRPARGIEEPAGAGDRADQRRRAGVSACGECDHAAAQQRRRPRARTISARSGPARPDRLAREMPAGALTAVLAEEALESLRRSRADRPAHDAARAAVPHVEAVDPALRAAHLSCQVRPHQGDATCPGPSRSRGFSAREIRIHVTFLLLLAWIGIAHYQQGGTPAAIQGIGFILALFACVVAHEFGHALAARRYGIRTPDITLLPIGGLARLERMPEKPGQEIVVALAGPAVNVVIAASLILVMNTRFDMEALQRLDNPSLSFMVRLASVNIFLVLFNLIPAFPMDGGPRAPRRAGALVSADAGDQHRRADRPGARLRVRLRRA